MKPKKLIPWLVIVLMIGASIPVQAKTVHGDFGEGTFEAMAMIDPTFTAVALSYQDPMPRMANAQRSLPIASIDVLGVDKDGDVWNGRISGIGACYRKDERYYIYLSGDYYMDSTCVATITVYS